MRSAGGKQSGICTGIYSVCSANRLVLEAAFAQSAKDRSPILIEATCNQVNQEGGYTGLTPAQFRDFVCDIANDLNLSKERLILGGDHLGPNPWRAQRAAVAMEKACAMVSSYVSAGYSKIHLDASMSCADDPPVLAGEQIAERAAILCQAAETAATASELRPVYVIGTEVPTPGGAQEESEIAVTTTESLQGTLDAHRMAFLRRHLSAAWDRIIGVVVQPGVEFGDATVVDYQPDLASKLSQFVVGQPRIVFEAHSTDYQTARSLRNLVRDHFAILKVGPELTFVMREAIFGLAKIEEEWVAEKKRSGIRAVIERVMLEHPENWKLYYHGNEDYVRIARVYSLSDRIRYYWPHREVAKFLDRLSENLRENPAPLTLISQYLPLQAEAIRAGTIENDPRAIIHHKIHQSMVRYATACGFMNREYIP